ncbi:MAG: FAD binding domain-containing protein, partial [Janthinobacterium lividum]
APRTGTTSLYLKLRDRASYEFALSSAAVVLGVANGTVSFARVALGGVGTRPWRSPEAEAVLLNKPVSAALFAEAAKAAVRQAHPRGENAFKVDLIQRCLVQALTTASAANGNSNTNNSPATGA